MAAVKRDPVVLPWFWKRWPDWEPPSYNWKWHRPSDREFKNPRPVLNMNILIWKQGIEYKMPQLISNCKCYSTRKPPESHLKCSRWSSISPVMLSYVLHVTLMFFFATLINVSSFGLGYCTGHVSDSRQWRRRYTAHWQISSGFHWSRNCIKNVSDRYLLNPLLKHDMGWDSISKSSTARVHNIDAEGIFRPAISSGFEKKFEE